LSVVGGTLEVFLFNEQINVLFDIGDFWHESRRQLADDFVDKGLMLQRLSRFHDTNNRSLKISYKAGLKKALPE
jgi:hypothetical protein